MPGSKGGRGELSEEAAAVTRRREVVTGPREVMSGQLMDLLVDWMWGVRGNERVWFFTRAT